MTKWLMITLTLSVQLSFANQAIEPLAPIKGKNILKFVAHTKILRDLSLYQIMKKRCESYSHQISTCKQNIALLIPAMDFDMVILDDANTSADNDWEINQFVFAAFKTMFIKVLAHPRIEIYLENVLKAFEDTEILKDFNLWDYTYRFTGKDRFLATAIMATLFQDTSMAVTHLEYIRIKKLDTTKQMTQNLDILSDIIIKISLLEEDNNAFSKKILFPREVYSRYLTTIYHFYVPAFLTQVMIKQARVGNFSGKEAALMLTLSYEFSSIGKKYEYVFKDPQVLTIKNHQNALQDIYTGYMGANFATDELYAAKSFHEMATAFTLSIYDAVTNYVLIR